MTDMENNRADNEVFAFFSKEKGTGGELPGHVIHYIPENRAEQVLALDKRIETAKKAMPMIASGGGSLLLICVAAAGWMEPGLAALAVAALLLGGLGKYRRGN